jgi:hypothetical protein
MKATSFFPPNTALSICFPFSLTAVGKNDLMEVHKFLCENLAGYPYKWSQIGSFAIVQTGSWNCPGLQLALSGEERGSHKRRLAD